jgi:hypothetical protein
VASQLGGAQRARRRGAPRRDRRRQGDGTRPRADRRRRRRTLGLFDVNVTALFAEIPARNTLEVRILPGTIDTSDVVRGAALVEALLERCLDETPITTPPAEPDAALSALREMASDVLVLLAEKPADYADVLRK